MRIHVLTLFPEMIEEALKAGVVGQALRENRFSIKTLNPRVFTSNVHQTVDGRPFGGGDGMLMLADTMAQALDSIETNLSARPRVIHLSPRGTPLTDKKVRELASLDELVLISSRYAGLDQRFLNTRVDEEISIGDYVLSGGELPALVIIDSVARLLPGVLGNEQSSEEESFGGASGLLEEPQFTRPREWGGQGVPEALLSGNHAKIERWKRALRFLVTLDRRPELVQAASVKVFQEARAVFSELSVEEKAWCGFKDLDALEAKLSASQKEKKK